MNDMAFGRSFSLTFLSVACAAMVAFAHTTFPDVPHTPASPTGLLRLVRVVHTLIWASFAGCILAIPVYAWSGEIRSAGILGAIVLAEGLIILVNRWRCPITDVAARYTDERRDNFDSYLPLWLARHNKTIFGALYAAGLLFTLARWRGWIG